MNIKTTIKETDIHTFVFEQNPDVVKLIQEKYPDITFNTMSGPLDVWNDETITAFSIITPVKAELNIPNWPIDYSSLHVADEDYVDMVVFPVVDAIVKHSKEHVIHLYEIRQLGSVTNSDTQKVNISYIFRGYHKF